VIFAGWQPNAYEVLRKTVDLQEFPRFVRKAGGIPALLQCFSLWAPLWKAVPPVVHISYRNLFHSTTYLRSIVLLCHFRNCLQSPSVKKGLGLGEEGFILPIFIGIYRFYCFAVLISSLPPISITSGIFYR
jgi:hypothetical protein